jgi:hypothetical protein
MDFLKARKTIVVTIAILLISFPTIAVPGTVTRAEEHQIKAAFVYNFSKFVTWPSNSFKSGTDPLRICVINGVEIGEALQALARKNSQGRQIQIVSLANAAVSEVDKCHLIFLGESTDASLTKKILNAVRKSPILTVGESPAFAHQGGVIGFIISGNKLAFEINPAIAKQSGLEISSKMLSLAKIVRDLP